MNGQEVIAEYETAKEKTLQSIDRTLKRMELTLLLVAKNLCVSSDDQAVLEAVLERLLEESSVG